MSRFEQPAWVTVRPAGDDDVDAVAGMIDDFTRGHPSAHHSRPREKLREALFGDAAVANLLVAVQRDRVVGMVQWFLFYDPFWAMYAAKAEWLYVRPEVRGLGIAAAIIAEVCARARRRGAEYLHGGGDDEASRLYERFAVGSATRECHLSAEAFQVVADLAGAPIRALVRGLPARELNRVPSRARTR